MMYLKDFVIESNRIEGIQRHDVQEDLMAHERFLMKGRVTVQDLERFVGTVAPGHVLRTQPGQDVRVGNHIAPRGGPDILPALVDILDRANQHGRQANIFELHRDYETLHPFTDGNGRSGRALWYWMMVNARDPMVRLGFLHAWYYQSLAATPERV